VTTTKLLALLASLPLALAAVGCAAESDSEPSSEESDLKNVEKSGGASQKWIYQGALPKLETPAITVSLKAHTARITGLLPVDFAGELPFYAVPSEEAGGRKRVTVVYPVATGAVDPSTGKAPAGPGHYSKLYGIAFTPTTDKAAWGGFPFMKYHASRGLAFHGPITSTRNAETGDWEWLLTRGPVSHGCQRMQGEHVVELSHLMGMNMAVPHKSSEQFQINVSVDILSDFDRTADGKYVDVDYPALASVKRPTGDVQMFRTWDSRNLPNIVCAYDSAKALDGHHCDAAGTPRQDVVTGEMLEIEETPDTWIGSECDSDDECGFRANGADATCLRSGDHGYCTVPCAGYCDDKAGMAPTFCGKSGDAGVCMSKADALNDGCADIEGTSVKQVERYVGSSGAAARVASVCSF
jgi:hypothetical protein